MTRKKHSPTPPGMSGAQIRHTFLEFFAARGHTIVPSSPLVPANDPSLLFTNAGMVQFKDVFLGRGKRSYTRAVDSQKCMRVAGKHNDLEDVGRDNIHHTFFEMLGNWSFGDYYKQETISWAWELLTEVWQIPKQQVWAACFEDQEGAIPRDDEAAEIWLQQPGFDPSHLLFFGRKENFWEMADTGPCGPDTEIHIDLGPQACKMQHIPDHICKVNNECGRFLELWNLVFIQYNRLSPTELEPLPEKHVDTGMGLDRLTSLLQGVDSNYSTDLFRPLMDRIQQLAHHDDATRHALLTPYRVICDHARAAAFLIADGVVPGNVGRNYVCRMIIRRASRFGGEAGFHEPFLSKIAETVIAHYGEAYPELVRNESAILSTIMDEEERFQHTLEAGMAHLEQAFEKMQADGLGVLPGNEAFELYATYGLPLEITRDIAGERGLQVDEAEFHQAMEDHRLASGSGQADAGQVEQPDELYRRLLEELQESGSVGPEGIPHNPYGVLKTDARLLAIIKDGALAKTASSGDTAGFILDRSPFYVAAGGQVSDAGTVTARGEKQWQIRIDDVRQPISGLIVHLGEVLSGTPATGDEVMAAVDENRRLDIMRNHTATHLLHATLRAVLGEHIRQAGSLVAPDRLRFDFTHSRAMTPEEVHEVEKEVNWAILRNYPLISEERPREEAIAEGAMALFGETYGDVVRTIRIGGEKPVSLELCGGTHVPQTGVIGPFIILSESSVAAGIRRIEATTGRRALDLIERRLAAMERIAHRLGTGVEELEQRIEDVLDERTRLAHEAEAAKQNLARAEYEGLEPQMIEGIPVVSGAITDASAETLRLLVDQFRSEHPSGVIVLGSAPHGSAILVAGVTKDLPPKGIHAGELAQAVAKLVGGKGGGKPTLAQAGGKDASRLPEALDLAPRWVADHLA
jgi:alanyl-tRNA synthetase